MTAILRPTSGKKAFCCVLRLPSLLKRLPFISSCLSSFYFGLNISVPKSSYGFWLLHAKHEKRNFWQSVWSCRLAERPKSYLKKEKKINCRWQKVMRTSWNCAFILRTLKKKKEHRAILDHRRHVWQFAMNLDWIFASLTEEVPSYQ